MKSLELIALTSATTALIIITYCAAVMPEQTAISAGFYTAEQMLALK